jgi:iron complex transport system substrate-binding protein
MELKKLLLIVLLMSTIAVAMSGCAGTGTMPTVTNSTGYPMNATDSYGRTVTITKAPERIVSLAPSNTEILFGLGLGDRVVGDTDYCNYPPEAKNKSRVGGITSVNVEKVVSLDPDLIFAASLTKKETIEKLDSMGYTVIAGDPKNASDVFKLVRLMGNVTGAQDNATRLLDSLNSSIGKITSVTSGLNESQKPGVLLVVYTDPIYVAGADSYGDDIIKMAGGRNVASGINDYGKMSTEKIMEADPDVIIVTNAEGMEAQYLYFKNASQPWMNTLSAVKNGRVYGLDSDTLSKPGPRMATAVELLAKAIHPELFE